MTTKPNRQNIFHKIVKYENHYTQLLCNLMIRYPDFRHEVFRLFFPEDLANHIRDMESSAANRINISTQTHLQTDGRPDIEITTDYLCAFIEVKLNISCPPMNTQIYSKDNDNSYVSNLKRNVSKKTRCLIYLVPHDWENHEIFQHGVDQLRVDEPSIHSKICYWEDILKIIRRLDKPTGESSKESFLGEFGGLLENRFGSVTFSAEETKMLYSPQFTANIRILEKLYKLIDDVKGIAKTKSYIDIKPEVALPDSCGFYFKKGDKDLLWFGTWIDFWEEEGAPLCFGTYESMEPEAKQAFLTAYTGVTKTYPGTEPWTIGWIPEDDLNSDDPASTIWKRLEPIVEKLYAEVK